MSRTVEQISPEQISSAVQEYRKALDKALTDISNTSLEKSKSQFREQTLQEIDSIGRALDTEYTESSRPLEDLEKSIAESARTIYGNKVGADSFIYLLIVFSVVFGLILLLPRLYEKTVAINILKAEFLLQFSTVFVLIAAIIILGIGELIDKQQLPVLLAGISGYVLGQLGNSKPTS